MPVQYICHIGEKWTDRYTKFDAVFCYEDVETVLWLLILQLALNRDYRGGRGAAGQDPTEKKPLRYRV